MDRNEGTYDLAIVGGGIVGLALACEGARLGRRIVVFERHPRARGATVRNFGMIWPIGQPAATLDRAFYSRETWMTLSREAGFWVSAGGSLHLAYHQDELHVLEEFADTTRRLPYRCTLITPEEAVARCPTVNPRGLEGALFSATEVNVDPREATAALHRHLGEKPNVHIHYGTAITHIDHPCLSDGRRSWRAERIYVCSGADFETLFPEVYAASGLTKCKLQMMRTAAQPAGYSLGPNLAAGLTLLHYGSFAHCESLRPLRQRLTRELAPYLEWGIHVMLSQTCLGELTIGDSHEYGLDLSPFDKQSINDLILAYLKKFARIPDLRIAETWNGIYAKLPGRTEFIAEPTPGVVIVNGLGGAGMTLSFGLARELIGADRVAGFTSNQNS